MVNEIIGSLDLIAAALTVVYIASLITHPDLYEGIADFLRRSLEKRSLLNQHVHSRAIFRS